MNFIDAWKQAEVGDKVVCSFPGKTAAIIKTGGADDAVTNICGMVHPDDVLSDHWSVLPAKAFQFLF